jgi:alpha-L-rhamnosidase
MCAQMMRKCQKIATMIVILLTVFAFHEASAQSVAANRIFTRGQWIAPQGEGSETGIYNFKKNVTLSYGQQKVLVRISADSQFILMVNGHRAAYGPSRSDLQHWRYEVADISSSLHPGENHLQAIVWKYPDGVMLSQMSRRLVFLMESVDPSLSDFDTNPSWQVRQDPERTFASANMYEELHNYYVAAPAEIMHGKNVDSEGWSSAQSIGSAALRGDPDGHTPWMLSADELPAMEYTAESAGAVVRQSGMVSTHGQEYILPAHSHGTILLDRKMLTTAYPKLVVVGLGAKIKLTYAEALYHDWKKGNRNEIEGKQIQGLTDQVFLDREGYVHYEPLNWRTWRYLQIEVESADQEVVLRDIKATFTAYPFVQKASFTSSDSSLDSIWAIGWRTARLDAHDTYMDTPYWERLQYVGDTRIQALISYAVTGDDRLGRQAIENLDWSRLPEGLTQSRYPSANVQMIPPFSLLWIDMLHDFWWYRDDDAFVKRHLQGERNVLFWFLQHQKTNGLLDKLPWWNFVDWTEGFPSGVPPQDANGDSAVITLQLIEALQNAAELERALGETEFAVRYDKARERAVIALRTLCWDHERGLFADTPEKIHFSQHANALAVITGVAETSRSQEIMEKIERWQEPDTMKNINLSMASYYFSFYLSRALEVSELSNQYQRTLAPWRKMMNDGLSTWAETPEPTRSDSHAWSAHPTFDLLHLVAGIRPSKPHFSALTIAPAPGNLTRFQAVYPHRLGNISVTMIQESGKDNFEFVIPSGLPSEFVWKGHTFPLHEGQQTLLFPE